MADRRHRPIHAHPAGHGEVVLARQRGVDEARRDHRDGHPFRLPVQTQAIGKPGQRRLGGAIGFRAREGQPVRHGADQHHPIASLQLRLQRRQAVHRPEEVGGHHPLHEGGIHLSVVEVFAGPGAENDQVGKTACQRLATGVPVCHIEQAYADVGAELLERCQARRIAPAGDDQMAIRREGFRQAGADPGAGASDEHRHHERTLRFTPRTAQPSRGRCS